MFKARTYQRFGSGQEGNIDVQSKNIYQRLGSGQEGNIDVRSKNIPEIGFWARR